MSLINHECEYAVVGALLLSPDAADLMTGLSGADFGEPPVGRVFDRAMAALRAGRIADPAAIAMAMGSDPGLAELGGRAFLDSLLAQAPPIYLVPGHVRTLADLSLRRALVAAGRAVAEEAEAWEGADTVELANRASEIIGQAAEVGAIALDGGLITAESAIQAAMEEAESSKGGAEFPTGLADLDRKVRGFQRGELTLIGGRPGSGKTILSLGLARRLAAAGSGTIYFSLEMSVRSLGARLGCDLAFERGLRGEPARGPRIGDLRGGNAEWAIKALHDARQFINAWPLVLDDQCGLTVPQIERKARRQHREWKRQGIKPGPIFVDHLGLIRPDRPRGGNRHSEVADISRGLAEMAKRLDVPVIALCQLNRGVESRDDKRPGLSDLRQAGELEEDARIVILLFREAYYLRSEVPGESVHQQLERQAEAARLAHDLTLIVAKNSNGPTGDVRVFIDIERFSIDDWEAAA
jgi:replicative DNA helicase